MVTIKQLSIISTLLFGLGQQVAADSFDDDGLIARSEGDISYGSYAFEARDVSEDELEVRYEEDLEARGIDSGLGKRGLPLRPQTPPPPKIVITPPKRRSLGRRGLPLRPQTPPPPKIVITPPKRRSL